ncbi:hypothetical protein [Micromonospora wenchangensis]|uniref:hypothetical protein n=1 Tax=Micromonospora wenchangensis TaxID=1185415 RepID=UPI003820AD97
MPRLTWRHRLARRFRPARLPAAAEPAQPPPPPTGKAAHPAAEAEASPAGGPGAGPTPPEWEDTTISFPRVGRVGWLTLAQEWRANRGRR